MSNTAQEVYTQVVRNLSPIERLRLANLILNELVQQSIPVIDISDTWTEKDKIDVTKFSLHSVVKNYMTAQARHRELNEN